MWVLSQHPFVSSPHGGSSYTIGSPPSPMTNRSHLNQLFHAMIAVCVACVSVKSVIVSMDVDVQLTIGGAGVGMSVTGTIVGAGVGDAVGAGVGVPGMIVGVGVLVDAGTLVHASPMMSGGDEDGVDSISAPLHPNAASNAKGSRASRCNKRNHQNKALHKARRVNRADNHCTLRCFSACR